MMSKMGKTEFIGILHDWNLWRQDLESGRPREQYAERVKELQGTKQIVTVVGARRAGKSFMMRHAAKGLVDEGVPKENILIVNFEDPRFPKLDVQVLNQIYEAYLEFLRPKGKQHVFLDEVQEVEGWEKWARAMHELQKVKLVVSGSNAKLLSRELGTLLTGRHLDMTVFPLSFPEFLDFNNVQVSDDLDAVGKQVEIRGLLRQYIEHGGFPEVTLSKPKKEILLGYFEDIVTKDLMRRFRVRKQEELKSLVRYYLSNVSSLSTFRSAGNFLGISSGTVEKFSSYLEQVYLTFFVKRFSFKVREQEKSPRKVYSIDTGLSNAVGFRFSSNIGRLAENVVFLALKQGFDPLQEIYYWKDQHHREVDFVVKKGSSVSQLIQVCWDVSDAKTKEREIRSLAKAMKELKVTNALVVTDEYEGEEEVRGEKIRFVPLWKWLLGVAALRGATI